MLYSRRGRPTDVPRNSSKMLSPRRMSVASVPFVAASRASSDANRRHPSGVPSTGAGGSTSTCAGTRCRSRAHASGEARRRRGLRARGGRRRMWRRGRRRRGRRRRGTPRADRARGRSTRRARTSPRTGPRRRWPIATRGVCPRGFPRAGVGGASRPRRRPAASTDCERGERRARRSTRPPREKTQTSVARTRQRRREDEPSRWTPSPTDGRRPRAARASLLTPDGTAGGWTMRGFRSRPARQRPHARCVKITFVSGEPLSTVAVLAARAETSEGVDDANARRASRGDAVSRRACSRLISNPAPRPVRASDPPPLKRALYRHLSPSL